MSDPGSLINDLSSSYQDVYRQNKVILTFSEFIELVRQDPRRFIRNSLNYLLDTLEYFGKTDAKGNGIESIPRYKVFDLGTEKGVPIVSGERAQREIVQILKSFERLGYASKLILLHGPNGSAKTSTVDAIANGMQKYSYTDDGAIYRFNWVFPADRDDLPQSQGESGRIGFGGAQREAKTSHESFALLDDHKISARMISEFKENPLFLLPMPQREKLLRSWLAQQENCSPDEVELLPNILGSGLSKKNQQIFENLLNAYGGDLSRVFCHVQVERFFFSRQYRVGISTVEPQMSVDAHEKQLTLDKNYQNLPTVLHTISFYQAAGELIEANRGVLEFSDLLKRPLEAFKYLLSTVEKGSVNLSSGTANLDVVFLGTTNEKHLDSFKTVPDFSSFKGRIELVTVPYLLLPEQEEKIYVKDIESIKKFKAVCPHALRMLCCWAVMTRLKQPDPEQFPKECRSLISRLDPYSKVLLYEGRPLQPQFTIEEQSALFEIKKKIWQESSGMVVYEGRFGASPREIRAILHKAAEDPDHSTLTPVCIFNELKNLIKDRTIYEFLQFEPRGQYHDASLFIEILTDRFLDHFESEVVSSMSMADEQEYDVLLKRYVDHVVAEIKKERIWDDATNTYTDPSQQIMEDVENILNIPKKKDEHRTSLLSRIAAFKIDHPDDEIDVSVVFYDFLEKIKHHFYLKMKAKIEENYHVMLGVAEKDTTLYEPGQITQAKQTFENMEKKFGYPRDSTRDCLRFLLTRKKKKSPEPESGKK